MNQLILASSSPRRQQILDQLKIPFTVRISDVDESKVTCQDPVQKVSELALLKARHTNLEHVKEVILAADTVVAFNNKIFGKPKNKAEAYQMIAMLSGNTHEVFTGVSIRSNNNEIVFTTKTSVQFWPLSEEEIKWYIETEEPYDKAGAYGIQGLAAIFIKQIIGDYYNVVGLPISQVVKQLRKFNIDIEKM